jgi:hypothetical protein
MNPIINPLLSQIVITLPRVPLARELQYRSRNVARARLQGQQRLKQCRRRDDLILGKARNGRPVGSVLRVCS